MEEHSTIYQRLENLKFRLDKVASAWTVDDYKSLLRFYVDIIPIIMYAERCTIFLAESETDQIWSIFGTGLESIKIEPPKNESAVGRSISTGQCIIEYDLDKRYGFHTEIDKLTKFITRNLICTPIKSLTGLGIIGAVEVLNKKDNGVFTQEDGKKLEEIAYFLTTSIESILLNRKILQISHQMHAEVERMDKNYFRDIRFIAESRVMRSILEKVQMISKTPVNVFLQGEHGTGKELIARMIHDGSDRREKPFIAVNCASIPETLMESEFFGYEKGAFTGAVLSHKGRFEEADGGTLFLDEVVDMPLTMQPKFLRAIQEGEGCRLGSNVLRHYNLRIISASNKDLRKEVAEKHFREDLFFRLFSIEVQIPPLRERKEDITLMAIAFLERVSHRFKRSVAGYTPEVLNLFQRYSWPGNVRQLLREIEHAIALTPEGEYIIIDRCSQELQGFYTTFCGKETERLGSLPEQVRELEIKLIIKALQETKGFKNKAASLLGITRQGLHKKLKRYKIENSATSFF